MRAFRRIISTLLAAALILTPAFDLALPLLAADTEDTAAADEIPEEIILAGFDSGVDGFRKSDNIRAVEAITSSDGSRNCLEAISYDVDVDLVRTITADLGVMQTGISGSKEPLDLSEYQRVACDVYVPSYAADPYAEYFLRITLEASDGSSTENIVSVDPDVWTTVGIDISGFSGRTELTGADISLLVSSSVRGTHRNSFYIDELRADEKIDRSHTKRFMLDRLNVTGGSAIYGLDQLVITLSENSTTSVSGTVFPTIPDWEVNALRLKIDNTSDVDSMTVFYKTTDGGLSEDRSVSVRLEKSVSKNYYIDVGDISKLSSLDLRFPSGSGHITITSICPVSQYIPTVYKTCGNITSCELTDDLLSIRFTGDVGREEVLSNQSGRLVFYAIDQGEDPLSVDFSALTPIAESPMTTKFDLSVDLAEAGEDIVTKQFVAFSKRTDDTYILIDPPFYVNNPERGAKYSVSGKEGKKGVVASDISFVGELRADSTILTLDVSRAFTGRTSGESFVCRGATYYLDHDYFTKLGEKISALSGAGVGVTLRLVGWNETFASELSAAYSLDRYNFYSEYNSTPDGNDFLAAIGVYIAEKFCADGSVTGIILGEGENFIGKVEGQNDSLTAMARRLANSLRTLKYAVAFVNSETKVYLSLSNLYSNELSSLSPEIGAEEFIPALCAEISLNGTFDFGLCIEDFYRFVDYDDRTMSAADADSLIALLRNSGVYDTRLIFHDSNYAFSELKSTDKMVRAVESFYSASFTDHIDAVYFELPDNADSRLVEVIRWIDSDRADDISTLILNFLKLNDWKELIDGFDPRKLPEKTLTSVAASTDQPQNIKGRYQYFSFDSFSGVSGFDPGFYCKSLTIVGSDEAFLRAVLEPADDDGTRLSSVSGMGMIYRFESPENMKFTPVLEATLSVSSESDSSAAIGVKFILTSGNDEFEATAELVPGERTTVYIDISDFSGIGDIESLQILTDGDIGVTVLNLYGMNGLSRDYNDESLESVITEERAKKRVQDGDDGYRNYLWIGGGVIVGAATVLTVMLLGRKKEDGDE